MSVVQQKLRVQLQQVDLNLLVPLHALLVERSVTRAAQRLRLSQPAMSRNLERLRGTLDDSLLLRTPKGYVLTRRAAELLPEIQRLLPQLEAFWTGSFSPATTTATVRFGMLDIVAMQLLTWLTQPLREQAPQLTLQVISWSEQPYDDLANGKVDLLLSPLVTPAPFRTQPLFTDLYTCIFSDRYAFSGKTLSLERYLQAKHISIDVPGGQQTLVDQPLLEAGYRRDVSLRLPYFLPALTALTGTDLLLTSPSRVVQPLLSSYGLRQANAPSEIAAFAQPLRYSMIWHPRSQTDALHSWFRNLVATVCSAIS